jgi:hypothetical protein
MHDEIREPENYTTATLFGPGPPECLVKMVPAPVRKHPWIALALVLAIVVGTVSVEGQFRRHWPESRWRPSVCMDIWAEWSKNLFRWVGYHLAWVMDIYDWIKEWILDFAAMCRPLFQLLWSPFYFFRGWYDYFEDVYNRWVSETIGTMALVGSTIAFLIVSLLVVRMYRRWKAKRA